ncbi:3-dehydroquinate synthetase [Planctomycetales bacterium 10988]|nr:3-dehydroquinate synthetase [Planctomycetales bacterium 10988]
MSPSSPSHPQDSHSPAVDQPFAVPFVHRLRFTKDVLRQDSEILADLLEPSGDRPARVQFWLDEEVAKANPELPSLLNGLIERHADRLELAGNIQTVVGGEAVKNDVHLLERMLKVFNAANLDRRSYIVVIGGGAVLDAVGFAAAIAHRGIRLVRLPTTTLAQGDSGIGVKNSVNLFDKKNWVGTFAVPWGVINDEALLATLPDRDFLCGFSEAVKVSLLKSPQMFDDLCQSAKKIHAREMSAAGPLLRASAEWHLAHITQGGDPFEALEARPLDYGHWSAHKMEVMTEFHLRHGEAVGIGVAIDTVYSSLAHGLSDKDAQRVLHCLRDLGLPLYHPILAETDPLFAGLEEFRQHLGGRLTVTMLDGIGKPINVHEIDHALMQQAIDQVTAFALTPSSSLLATKSR